MLTYGKKTIENSTSGNRFQLPLGACVYNQVNANDADMKKHCYKMGEIVYKVLLSISLIFYKTMLGSQQVK